MVFFNFSKTVKLKFVLVVLTIENVSSYMIGNNPYHQRELLDSKYLLEWLTDWNTKTVAFNVTVETRGYVGFGLSSSSTNKMVGSDIVMGGVRPSGEVYFSDRHAIDNQVPEVDKSQDWKLIRAWENRTHTFLSFSRPFDTCDPDDYPITNDRIVLMWAYGETDNEEEYHHQNRGSLEMYLIEPNYVPPTVRDGEGMIVKILEDESLTDIQTWTLATKMVIPERDTLYWCTIHRGPRITKKHHIVGMEIRFPTEQDRRHTHHFGIHRCAVPAGTDARAILEPYLNHEGQECFIVHESVGDIPTQHCTAFFLPWGLGGKTFFMPPHVGIPIGDSENPEDEFVLVQMHYDNPNRLENVTVEALFDFYYTSNLRANEAAGITLRTPTPGLTPTILVPPSTVDHNVYVHCSPECTEHFLPKEGINLMMSFLHAHNSGVGMRVHHFRNNVELPWVSWDDNYSNGFQPYRLLLNEVKLLPGDQLTVSCTYDNTWTNSTVVGGLSTRQEMCFVFLLYYNKIPDYAECSSQMETAEFRNYFLGVTNITWSNSQLEYVVDPPHRLAGQTITQVSDNHVNWSLRRRAELRRFHLTHSQVNYCPRIVPQNATDHNVVGEGVFVNPGDITPSASYPLTAKPYKPPRTCSF